MSIDTLQKLIPLCRILLVDLCLQQPGRSTILPRLQLSERTSQWLYQIGISTHGPVLTRTVPFYSDERNVHNSPSTDRNLTEALLGISNLVLELVLFCRTLRTSLLFWQSLLSI